MESDEGENGEQRKLVEEINLCEYCLEKDFSGKSLHSLNKNMCI